jgi:hypothetical protein
MYRARLNIFTNFYMKARVGWADIPDLVNLATKLSYVCPLVVSSQRLPTLITLEFDRPSVLDIYFLDLLRYRQ